MNHYEKKDKKEIKSNLNCKNCSRQLTASELFYFSDNCIICRLKNGPNLSPYDINKENVSNKKE